jgi:hypothetical protein
MPRRKSVKLQSRVKFTIRTLKSLHMHLARKAEASEVPIGVIVEGELKKFVRSFTQLR